MAYAIRNKLNNGFLELQDIAEASRKLEIKAEEVRRLEYDIRQQNQNVAALGAGQKLHERRAQLKAEIERIHKEIEALNAKKSQLEKDLVELSGEEAKWTRLSQESDRSRTLASRASQYREAAGILRKRASDQMRERLNKIVGDLWIEIVGRHKEFSGVVFDPYWNCHLLKRNGDIVAWDDINASAGQLQVRFLAFYEALRRLAFSIPPLVVDTPLGRLDKEVRAAVLDRLYLSNDGHQSIVLATNAEIDPLGDLFYEVRKKFGRAYTLIPQGRSDSDDYFVRVEEDYFNLQVS
jgi:DNA sulfur modification protein DndD